jgi:hypothetical protein
MSVWLFGLLVGSGTVHGVVKLIVAGRVSVAMARAQADTARAVADAQSVPVFVPRQWTEDEL